MLIMPCRASASRCRVQVTSNVRLPKTHSSVRRHLKNQLLARAERDAEVREELEAAGLLSEGYHPRMEELHRENARQLRSIIAEHGWPHEELVGQEGAEAAWLIAQHSIGEPDFMRHCRELLDEASRMNHLPRWQFAYIDDRIRVFEGKAQRFGTQIDIKPSGAELNLLEDPTQVEVWRKEVGLGTVKSAVAKFRGSPRPSKEAYAAKQAEQSLWLRKVGWQS
jgi:hypothetical protein